MYLFTILAFAFLFWRLEGPRIWRLPPDDVVLTLTFVVAQLVGLSVAFLFCSRRVRTLLLRGHELRAHTLYHRSNFTLRAVQVLAFGASVICTNWADWFDLRRIHPVLQLVGDLLILVPYVLGSLIVWLFGYYTEQYLRAHDGWVIERGALQATSARKLLRYLDFHFRQQFLVAAVPMTIILYAADLTRSYEDQIRSAFRWVWAPDAILTLVAALVFLASPIMLAYLWQTTPLPPGPLRDRLEKLCRDIGLRCRDILVWKSDGQLINAAVMGVIPQVRYVLLSDALLATMSEAQIQAVFGHEAGHVRHHHIQHFLVFAFVGWVVVAAIMEALAQLASTSNYDVRLAGLFIQGIGVLATIVFWGIGFGWISRRFERQADLFGARCASTSKEDCKLPCPVHLGDHELSESHRVCASGAATFASALQRVAILNGIPLEEPSWRHSSIGDRLQFLTSLVNDVSKSLLFERSVRRIKRSLVVAAVLGAAGTVWYWSKVPEPAIFRLSAGAGPDQADSSP